MIESKAFHLSKKKILVWIRSQLHVPEISKNLWEFSREVEKSAEVSWNFPESSKNLREISRTFKTSPEFSRISRNFPRFCAKLIQVRKTQASTPIPARTFFFLEDFQYNSKIFEIEKLEKSKKCRFHLSPSSNYFLIKLVKKMKDRIQPERFGQPLWPKEQLALKNEIFWKSESDLIQHAIHLRFPFQPRNPINPHKKWKNRDFFKDPDDSISTPRP